MGGFSFLAETKVASARARARANPTPSAALQQRGARGGQLARARTRTRTHPSRLSHVYSRLGVARMLDAWRPRRARGLTANDGRRAPHHGGPAAAPLCGRRPQEFLSW